MLTFNTDRKLLTVFLALNLVYFLSWSSVTPAPGADTLAGLVVAKVFATLYRPNISAVLMKPTLRSHPETSGGLKTSIPSCADRVYWLLSRPSVGPPGLNCAPSILIGSTTNST